MVAFRLWFFFVPKTGRQGGWFLARTGEAEQDANAATLSASQMFSMVPAHAMGEESRQRVF